MPKFTLLHGTKDCSNGAEVRKRMRESAKKLGPHCRHCSGRETVVATNGNVRNKLCVVCLMQGRRVVVE